MSDGRPELERKTWLGELKNKKEIKYTSFHLTYNTCPEEGGIEDKKLGHQNMYVHMRGCKVSRNMFFKYLGLPRSSGSRADLYSTNIPRLYA